MGSCKMVLRVERLLNQTVTIKQLTSRDSDGNPSYATAANVAARVSCKPKRMLGLDGAEFNSYARITVKMAVNDGASITFVDGTGNTRTMTALEIRRAVNRDGTHGFSVIIV